MAGAGSRFTQAGYNSPKPLIDVLGKPMIQRVVENLCLPEAKYVFIVQAEHREKFGLDEILKRLSKFPIQIFQTEGVLPGALLSVLEARETLRIDEEMIIANSDQLTVTRPSILIDTLRQRSADGGFMTFKASGNGWSYALVNESGVVSKVAEKQEISNNATIGVYYWRSSRYFLECADEFIRKGVTTNSEFYVSPVYNEAIGDGKMILAVDSFKHVSLGTPEQLQDYLRHKG